MIYMIIHLDEDIFEVVRDKKKTVEVRVNDEKRRKLKIGDTITFLKRPDDIEKIDANIENLKYYKDYHNKLISLIQLHYILFLLKYILQNCFL